MSTSCRCCGDPAVTDLYCVLCLLLLGWSPAPAVRATIRRQAYVDQIDGFLEGAMLAHRMLAPDVTGEPVRQFALGCLDIVDHQLAPIVRSQYRAWQAPPAFAKQMDQTDGAA